MPPFNSHEVGPEEHSRSSIAPLVLALPRSSI
jgi:hypothetical protein